MTEIKQLKIFIKHIGFSLQIDLVSVAVDMQRYKQVARSNLIQIISDMEWDYYKLGNEKCLSFFGFQLSIRVVSWHKVDYQIEGNVRKTFLTMLLWLSKEIFNFPFCENKKVLRSFVENISFKISFYLHTSKLKIILDNSKN